MYIKKLENDKPTGNLILNTYNSLEEIADAGYCVYDPHQSPPTERNITKEWVVGEDKDMGNNNWCQTWVLSDVVYEDEEQRQAAIEIAKKTEWDEVRRIRNYYLKETDWLGNSDVEMPADVAEYRQKLRDITTDNADPYNIDWPIDPQEGSQQIPSNRE
jgi:hypothetical protein